jgi:hypothetical protein
MLKQLSTGLVAGAVAVLALVLSRPVSLRQLPAPPPPSPAATSLIAAHVIDTTQEHAADVSTRAAVRAKLDKLLPAAEFEAATLDEVARRFGDWTGANVIVDPNLPEPSTVTVRLKEMRAGDALRVVLAVARPQRAYRIWSGSVVIGEGFPQMLEAETRLYDIRDLLDEAKRQDPAYPTQNSALARSVPSGVPAPISPTDHTADLMTVIRESVDPSSWRDAGGSVGSMSPWAGRLLISQTVENHQKIEQLLAGCPPWRAYIPGKSSFLAGIP